MRSALGAGSERLVRMVLIEALLLALAGGALGVVVAVAGLALVRALGLDQSSEGFAFVLDTRRSCIRSAPRCSRSSCRVRRPCSRCCARI